jgi:hypothetical protein
VTTIELHQAQLERCADNMLGMLNNEILALMTSIGHRTGLSGTTTILPASTSAQIAAAAGLHKRYGRE